MTQPDESPDLELVTAALRADSADAAIYARVLTESLGESLPPGSAFAGPAIVAEDETSTYISASFAAHIDASGCIVMDRKDA